MQADIERDYRHNFTVNLFDGSFFGLAMGFASSVTILPLFVATLTDSTILIGLIGSLHLIGAQLPQLLMVARVAGLRRYKRLALLMSLQERVPFLGLTLVALLSTQMSAGVTLVLCYGLFIWHSLGSGLTATPYQSMLSKIFPERQRGMFLGSQMAGYSLLSGLGAIVAGGWLANIPRPYNYALCFLAASVALLVSWLFLSRTREPEHEESLNVPTERVIIPWGRLRQLWRTDGNFRWFVLARMCVQFVLVALNFYSVAAIQRFAMDEQTLGVMTGLLFFAQIAASLLGGWIGDRAGHRVVLAAGTALMSLSAVTAAAAPEANWFYVVYILAGLGSAILVTNIVTMTMEFGQPAERPFYIGLANTVTAFATLAAPLVAGWLVQTIGYPVMFGGAGAAGVVALVILLGFVVDPRRRREAA
ncbi:MAG: MFS transporter [Anaerolineae bacterium]|nr:MFS transporter [Anaerolineae bacterium]